MTRPAESAGPPTGLAHQIAAAQRAATLRRAAENHRIAQATRTPDGPAERALVSWLGLRQRDRAV